METRPPSLRYAWYVVLALTAIYMLSYMDRVILSLLVAPMKRDFGISDTQVGLMQGLAFALFYTLVGLPMGRIADTRNRRNLIAAGVVLWSFFTALCSMAGSFWPLFFARMGVGVGEASLSPSAYSLISDYFPKEKLGAAISVFYMGVFLGTSASLLLTGSVIDALSHTPLVTLPVLGTIASWRVTFLMFGLPGLLFALLAYTIREPARRDLALLSAGGTRLGFRDSFVEIRKRTRSLLGISMGSVFQAIPAYALISWTPTFLQRVHGWTAGQSGRGLAALLLTCGCAGMFAGGRMSDYWQKHGRAEGPLRVGVVCGFGTLLLAAAYLPSQVSVTFWLLGPGIFFVSLAMGTSPAALQRIFPNQVRGQVSAFFLFLLNLGGLGLGTLVPGYFDDHLFHDPKMIGTSLALTIAVSSVLMLIAFRATYAPYRADCAALTSPGLASPSPAPTRSS